MSAPVGSGQYDSLHITVIQDWDLLNEISNAVTEMMVKIIGKRMDKNFGAPTMVIVSSKPAMMPGLEYANVGCVLENMVIAATSLGIDNIIWAVGLAVYFIFSFATNAWYITWLVFPLTGAVQGLVKAILDLKEANENEK